MHASLTQSPAAARTWKRLFAMGSIGTMGSIKKGNSMTEKVSHQTSIGRLPTARIFLLSWFGA
jgi:hypothetical protein